MHDRKRQPEAGRSRRGAGLAWLAALLVAGPAGAQSTFVAPSVNARLTFSDNVGARSNGERSDWILEVAPAIAVTRTAGRFTGNLRAQLRNLAYVNESDRSTSYLALAGSGSFEAVDRLLFIDMDASMSRNNRSDLFGRAPGDFLATGRGSETRLFSIGPRAEFQFGGTGRGTVSYLARWLDGSGGLDQRRVDEWRGQLTDPLATSRLGWSLDYYRSDTSFDDAADTEVYQQTARATLFATVSPQLRLRGIVGRESTDYTDRSGESGTIKGGGFDWYPTDRTNLTAIVEDRLFGRGYNVGIRHRRPLSNFELSYSRDISSSLRTFGSVLDDPTFRSVYDSLDPNLDPFAREQLARDILAGLGFNFPVASEGFVTKAYFLDRRLRASASLVGARNVLSLTLLRSDRERLDTFEVASLSPDDDFSLFERIRTDSGTVALSHRLSGLNTLNTSYTRSRTKGSGGTIRQGETRRNILSVGLNSRLSPRSTAGLTYRHQRAEGVSDFTENVLTASLAVRF